MPSTSSAKKTVQCVYTENKRRCRRNAVDERFKLCGVHRQALDTDRPSSSPLGDILGSVLNGERITKAQLEQAGAEFASKIMGRKVTAQEIRDAGTDDIREAWQEFQRNGRAASFGDFLRQASQRASSAAGARPIDPEAQAREQRAKEYSIAVTRARRTLGFTAREPITVEMVKARQRELARKHHPDKGGDVARMQSINAAVDVLLKKPPTG